MKKASVVIKSVLAYGLKALLLAGLALPHGTAACDVCGGAGAGSSLGVLPRFGSSFAGVRYQFKGSRSFPHESAVRNDPGSTERYHTLELAGRAVLHRRLHLYAFLPVVFHRRLSAIGMQNAQGAGDPSLLLNLIILNGPIRTSSSVRHLLQGGLGAKAPLGRYDAVQNKVMLNPNLQAGSGSWDGVFHALYALSGKRLGSQLEANARLCGANKLGYRFGHRAVLAGNVFSSVQTASLLLIPLAGLQTEWSGSDGQRNETVDMTGGWSAQFQAGLQAIKSEWQLGVQGGLPFYTRLSEGHVKPTPRLSVQLLYYLTKTAD